MQMAREAASLALDSLDATDRIGVLQFDTQSRWVVQPRPVGTGAQVDQIKERIKTIEASGGTELYPALDMGYKAIRETPGKYKHIILLTDGRSLSSADYDKLIAQMRQDSVTLSTIAIGSDADTQLLEDLAKQGEGRYYYVDRFRDIPKVTTKEAKIASGSPIVEGDIQPKLLAPSPIMRGIASWRRLRTTRQRCSRPMRCAPTQSWRNGSTGWAVRSPGPPTSKASGPPAG
jgi:uncharacterized protein (DUF58 family)